jgi:hypothetical protein
VSDLTERDAVVGRAITLARSQPDLVDAAPELLEALVKYHEWLEEHERRNMGPPRTGYIGLDHRVGENIEGCDGCAAIAKATEQSHPAPTGAPPPSADERYTT